MQDILNQLSDLYLTPDQCDELLPAIKKILENKKTKNDIGWLIQNYHIDKHFYCLNNAIRTIISQYPETNGISTYLSIEFPTRHDRDGWETRVCIQIQNDIIINVFYETDRYARYDYNERLTFPYGQFQGTCLKSFYKDQTKSQCIQSDIDEIKELCSYFFKF